MTKPFAVILFKNDNTVTAVPITWLSVDEEKCAWPVKKPPNFKRIIQDENSKPDEDWMWLEIELKKKYKTYALAFEKTKKHLTTDAVPSGSEVETTPRSRKRNQPQRKTQLFLQTGNLDRVHEDYTDVNPPSLENFRIGMTQSNVQSETEVSISDDTLFPNNVPGVASNYLPDVPTDSDIATINVVDAILRESVNNLTTELEKFEEIVLGKLEELRRENRETKQLLLTVLSKLDGDGGSTSGSALVFSYLPMQSEDDFIALEKEIKDNDRSYLQLVNHLKRGGGDSLPDNVYTILRGIFTSAFAKTIRLTSTSGKRGFRESKIADCVREAVHSSIRLDNSLATDKSINNAIGSWLRQNGYERPKRNVKMDEKKEAEKIDCSSTDPDSKLTSKGTTTADTFESSDGFSNQNETAAADD